jgi:pimeloyl-ACP methyl ester carboxylesterase
MTSVETDRPAREGRGARRRGRFRRTKKALMVLVALMLALSLVGGVLQAVFSARALAEHPPTGRMISVDGHRLHIDCQGSGGPTVVLESSLAGWSIDWSRVQPELARTNRVCSYDRAGYGWSDPGPLPRTPQRLVSELHDLLRAAGERPPYVLVGHSLGGLLVRLYAGTYPKEVVGLVLVEAAHEDMLRRSPNPYLQRGVTALRFLRFITWLGIQRVFRQPASNSPRMYPPSVRPIVTSIGYRANGYNTLYHELAAEVATSNDPREHDALKRRARSFPPVPLVVLTSRHHVSREPVWGDLQAELVKLSPRGRQVFAEKADHQIELEEPNLIVDAVKEVTRPTH